MSFIKSIFNLQFFAEGAPAGGERGLFEQDAGNRSETNP